MTAVLRQLTENRFVHWLLQAKRLPLLYAVTVMTAIMYHYNPAWTPVWLVLTFVLELGVFKLCAFVEKHHFMGGILFCLAGIATLGTALVLIYIGEAPDLFDNLFLPKGVTRNIDFYIWFLTPQSVLNAFYGPYTIALLLLFSFFIGFATYYFTFVQYRILMSFSILCFPFAIYAKEAEDMPIFCIIILFACYFAVMLFCRQLHADDPDVIYYYQKDRKNYPMPTVTAKTHSKDKPELSDGAGWRAGALFLCAACIVVLAVPKPTVHENRGYIEGLINMTAFTDFLLNAINGFEEESDGGTDALLRTSQVLFYASADENVNLRRATMSHYSYESDSWKADDWDGKQEDTEFGSIYNSMLFHENFDWNDGGIQRNFKSACPFSTSYDWYRLLRLAAERSPSFAEKWGLTQLAATDLNTEAFMHQIVLTASSFNGPIYLAPNQTVEVHTASTPDLLQNASRVIYREQPDRIFHERYNVEYLSDKIVQTPEMQMILSALGSVDPTELLSDIEPLLQSKEEREVLQAIEDECLQATIRQVLMDHQSETPERVRALAADLTKNCGTDYEKACAIERYLLNGEYIYNLDYIRGQGANVETFLFESKEGVCYQFASAMAELCRNAGLKTRYVEGYSMSERDNNIFSSEGEYVIRTNHAHAFVEIYLAGYGWMSFDATAPDYLSGGNGGGRSSVLGTLQFTGMFLLIGGILVLLVLCFVVPVVQEKWFRHKYLKARDGKAIEAAFARLRKQWNADPALTARVLCGQMAEQLHCDTDMLLQGVEAAVYDHGCTRELADAVFANYCELCKAWKETQKRLKKEAHMQKKHPVTQG